MKRRNLLLVAASAAVLCAGLGMTACWGERDLPEDIPMTESFELLADGTYELTRVEWGYSYRENRSTVPEEYTIPSEHEGIPVTSVASGAVGILWRGDESPENVKLSVTIPAGIKHLGRGSIEATTVNWNAVSVEDKEDDWGSSIVSRAETVVFGEGVERIPAQSFLEYRPYNTLTSVTLSDSIEEIGEYAFYECFELKSIDLPENLKTIGEGAFLSSGLTSIALPEGLQSIGDAAFSFCGLTEIAIPESVTSIGKSALTGNNFTSITLPFIGGSREENKTLSYLFKDLGISDSYWIESPLTELQSLTVTGVSEIPEEAFNGFYASCATITLPETVTSIAARTFHDCDVKEIIIPNGVTSIGEEAFAQCRVEKLILPDGLQFIGERAFEYSGVKELILPEGITEIKNALFSGCYALKKLTLPNGLTKLNAAVLEGCNSLESLTMPYVPIVDKNGKEQTSLSYLFYQQYSLLDIRNIPETLTAIAITKATELGDHALSGFKNMKSVTLPEELTSFGEWAFNGCSSLTSIPLPEGLQYIGERAFNGCSSLTSLTLPEGLQSIVDYAFSGCGAEEIILPDALRSIGESAFESCSNLGSIVIPEQITSIKNSTFSNCDSLTSVMLPNGLQSIGKYAFYSCDSLTSITLPENLTAIGEYVFRDCGNLSDIYYKGDFANYMELGIEITHDYNRLNYRLHLWNGTEYYEPTSAEVLPSQLWIAEGISSLTEIICKYEEGSAYASFYGFSALETVKFEYLEGEIAIDDLPSGVEVIYGYNLDSGTENGFDYIKRGNSVMLTAYSGNAERIILPAQIEGVAITKLGSIFKNNTTVKEVVIPEGYTEIADETFYGCTALEIVYIPSTITKMGENVFYNNNMAYNAPSNLPFANDGSYILSGIYTSLSLSASTGNWTDKAYFIHKNSHFDADSKIIYEYGGGIEEPRILRCSGTDSTVTVPATIENIAVKEIYYFAFYGIQTLNSVTLSEGIESIGKSAFEDCSALQNVSLPQSLTTIAAGAFKDCSNLTTITIPRAVKMIGDHVFTGCSALASISFEQPIGWTSYTFTNAGANIDSAQSHDMSDTAECVTVLRDTYAERMFVNSGANTTV